MKKVLNTDISTFIKIIESNTDSKVEKIKYVGGGSFGQVFKAILADGRVIAVKAHRRKGFQYSEAERLTVLAQNTSVKMPEVVFTYGDETSDIIGMTFIEGKNVLSPQFLLFAKNKKAAFADAVVDGLLELHSVKGEKYGSFDNPQYESWKEYYINEKQIPWLKGLENLVQNGKFSLEKLELLRKATEIFNAVPDESECPVLIHGDLNIMNIMADPKTFELTGFIDPGEPVWTDREYDLFQFRNMWGDSFGLYENYKSRIKTSEHTDFRVAYYGAMNEASCRMAGGLIVPLWEDLCNIRLKKIMKKYL